MKSSLLRIGFVLLALISLNAQANDFGYEEGLQYKKVPQPQSIAPHQNKVQELFFYGCPHCYHLEPSLKKWKQSKSSNVDFEQVPAVLNNPNWVFMARVFYTAKNLGILDQFHEKYFTAIQRDKRRIFDLNSLSQFVAPMGVSAEDYKAMFKSFKVDQDVKKAKMLTDAYGIDGVPAVIVNGQHLTDVGMAGSREKLWNVVNHLTK